MSQAPDFRHGFDQTEGLMNIEPGIYFGLDETTYHAAPWLGSSNIKALYSSPPDFWFDSWMNPMRPKEQPTFAQVYGRAIHHRILYGEASFLQHYQAMPGEEGDSVSAAGLKIWLESHGHKPAKLKADNEAIIRELGVNLLTEDTFRIIMIATQHILKNPHLGKAFEGGWPEVSIFWEEDGVPMKARIDYLKKRAIVDLKSFRSKSRNSTLDRMVLSDLFGYGYHIQVSHYQRARQVAIDLLNAGKVFGETVPSEEWLRACLTDQTRGWVFVFFKSDGMPIAKSYQIPYDSPAHQAGNHARSVALAAYKDNLERFGADAWVNCDEPYQITEEDLPGWL
jgi:hypothetical protein